MGNSLDKNEISIGYVKESPLIKFKPAQDG